MTNTQTQAAKPKRNGAADGRVLVSSYALAAHLGCSRPYIAQLTAEGVIEKRSDGYDQDACRLKYLTHLREQRRRSPRNEADAAHATAKTALLQIRLDEQRRVLIRRDKHEAMLDQIAGLVLTKIGGWPARIAGRDLALRRKAEALLRELRSEIAEAATTLADAEGEPPLDQD